MKKLLAFLLLGLLAISLSWAQEEATTNDAPDETAAPAWQAAAEESPGEEAAPPHAPDEQMPAGASDVTSAPSPASTNAPKLTLSPPLTDAPAVSSAPADANAPTATPSVAPGSVQTNLFGPNTTIEELEKLVLKPPTSKAPVSVMPTLVREGPPPLTEEAQKHEYLGFRIGMPLEEAKLVARLQNKEIEEVIPNKRYQMDGCLTEVPKPEKAKTLLLFEDGKLEIVMLVWDADQRMFIELEPLLLQRYGRPLRADELFRRYWVLENDDCIRMLYQVGGNTSLAYGSKEAVFGLSEQEKREIPRSYKGL